MGAPVPNSTPPPHGTKHCQRNSPPWGGVMKLNLSSEYGPDTQGAVPHGPADASGESTGTKSCRLGIANVCPPVQCDQPFSVGVMAPGPLGLLGAVNCRMAMTPPIVPWTWLQ